MLTERKFNTVPKRVLRGRSLESAAAVCLTFLVVTPWNHDGQARQLAICIWTQKTTDNKAYVKNHLLYKKSPNQLVSARDFLTAPSRCPLRDDPYRNVGVSFLGVQMEIRRATWGTCCSNLCPHKTNEKTTSTYGFVWGSSDQHVQVQSPLTWLGVRSF